MTEQPPASEEPTPNPSTFGSYLKNERKQSGYTLRKLSSRTNFAISTLSRWENGHVTPARDDVCKVEKVLGTGERLLVAWELETSGGFPSWMRDVNRLEEAAELIELISPHVVPGLLQSPEYARLVFTEGLYPRSANAREKSISARSSRYEVLRSRNDPEVIAVFPVTALTCVAEPVRVDQVSRLLDLADTGRVTIHLIPEGSILVGVTSMLIMFHLSQGRKAAVSDHVRGATLYDEASGYDRLHGLIKRSLGAALPAAQSRKVLEELR